MRRRGFLRVAGVMVLSLLLVPLRVLAGMTPRVFKTRKIPLPVTPTPEFYIEDYSGPPASLNDGAETWRMSVTGRVNRPVTLDYTDIKKLPSVTRIITLNCIGNPVGGHAIGNARWKGISLSRLIDEADPTLFSRTLIVSGADGYRDSLPLKKARHPAALLAYEMNGQPLTPAHGFPLRLLIPGLYGIKQVKWITQMEVADRPFEGYWQKRGWSRSAGVKIFSRIDAPENGERLQARSTVVRGIAFTGDRGIRYVQVSVDGERTWALARLLPALSPWAWVFWTFPVTFFGPGRHRIAVRAVDQYSGTQQDDSRDPFPGGTSGIHRIEVEVP